MHVHKSRVPIDYVHDSKEVIGYLNKFDTSTGDLVTSGALVPFKESDRATEIVHKVKAGVPYEASINFGGDGLKVQEIPDGEECMVNGAKFSGPGIVIREWPLRGVAICPYGADMNTESNVFSDKSKTFSASVIPAPKSTEEGDSAMSKPVEVVAVVADVPVAVTLAADVQKPVEVKPVEAVVVAPVSVPAAAVEAAQPEGPAPVSEKKTDEVVMPDLSRDEFIKIADKYGDDIAVKCVRTGGSFATATDMYLVKLESENKTLRSKADAQVVQSGGTPAAVVAVQKPVALFNTKSKK
jgi:hypothetical protein